jgi:hypothetical protein
MFLEARVDQTHIRFDELGANRRPDLTELIRVASNQSSEADGVYRQRAHFPGQKQQIRVGTPFRQ